MPSSTSNVRCVASTVRGLLFGAAATLLAGCASAPHTPAVYCVNAPNAGTPPDSVTAAYCINLPQTLSLSSATQAPPAPVVHPPEPVQPPGETANGGAPPIATATTAGAAASSPPLAATRAGTQVANPPVEQRAVAPAAHGSEARSAPASAAYVAPHGALALASKVDVDRFMGRWYVIAFIPYAFENGRVGAYYEFNNRGGGEMDFSYFSHLHDFDHPLESRKGRAYVVKNTHGAKWRVTYTWPIYTSFPIIYVDPDYSVALIGYPGRSLGWVLSRKPQMDAASYRALLARFAAQGYDVSQFRRVPQSPEQVQG